MSFKSWEKPLGFLPPGQYELDPSEPINQAGPPVAAWYAANLPGGPTLVDLSHNGNHGALQGSVSWAAGRDGPVLDFPGATGDYVEVPPSPGINGAGDFTIVARLKHDDTGRSRWLTKTTTESKDSTYYMYSHLPNAGDLQGAVGDGDTNDFIYISNAIPLTSVYYNTAFSYVRGGISRLYVDGVEIGSDTLFDALANSSPLFLGRLGGFASNHHDGVIDHVMFFNRALPAADIRKLHDRPYALLRPVRRWWAVALEAGITHPVIGSGIVNSEAVIGGAQ